MVLGLIQDAQQLYNCLLIDPLILTKILTYHKVIWYIIAILLTIGTILVTCYLNDMFHKPKVFITLVMAAMHNIKYSLNFSMATIPVILVIIGAKTRNHKPINTYIDMLLLI